jgi:chemotaxis protein MotB
MGQNREPIEEEEDAGAPEWMVTFSDCMTLLLTFFVLLLSFSSFDDAAMMKVQDSLGVGAPAYATQMGNANSSLSKKRTVKKVDINPKGSVTPTPPTDKALGSIAKNRRLTQYERLKVFSIASNKVFVGNATAINPANKQILKYFVAFLKAVPSRIVISEIDPANPDKSDRVSIRRAWALMNFFIQSKVEADRFSITGSSMLGRNDNIKGRKIVITLLEEGMYE